MIRQCSFLAFLDDRGSSQPTKSHFQVEGDRFLLSVRTVGIMLPLSEVAAGRGPPWISGQLDTADLTTSPQGQQHQQKQSIRVLHKPAIVNSYRQNSTDLD